MVRFVFTSVIGLAVMAAQCVVAQTLNPVFTDTFLNGSTTGTTSSAARR